MINMNTQQQREAFAAGMALGGTLTSNPVSGFDYAEIYEVVDLLQQNRMHTPSSDIMSFYKPYVAGSQDKQVDTEGISFFDTYYLQPTIEGFSKYLASVGVNRFANLTPAASPTAQSMRNSEQNEFLMVGDSVFVRAKDGNMAEVL